MALFPILFALGESQQFQSPYWNALKELDTRNHRRFSDRLFPLVYKIAISLASPRLASSDPCPFHFSTTHISYLGSGKTAAFVIPMLAFISNLPPFTDDNRHLGPYALILAPTRELAQQIETEARKFASPLGFKCVSIVGGVSGLTSKAHRHPYFLFIACC